MTCRQSEELIQKSLDGALTSAERVQLDTHMAECSACRSAWDEYRRLARLAHRWVSQASQGQVAGEAFTARVLSQLMVPPVPSPARADFRLPLYAVGFGFALLAFLFPVSWPGLPEITGSAWDLPHWLFANGGAVPSALLWSWRTQAAGLLVPTQGWILLLAAGAANGLFLARAAMTQTKGSLR